MARHPRIAAARQSLALSCLLIGPGLAEPVLATTGADWQFSVMLDGRAIGTHRFELRPAGDAARALTSDARFDVKVLGLTVYRYRHQARERWQGDCLDHIESRTEDAGEVTVVRGQAVDGVFRVTADTDRKPLQSQAQGCLTSFAYWNPRQLANQQQLLDQGTGRIQPVTITPLPATRIDVRGNPTTVTGLRISGLKAPIDVWYADDHWVGLDTTAEGRALTYRLP
jgi:hypothetical protein